MEKRNLEQCCAIKFCVKLNENATETYEKLRRAYGERAVSRTQVFRWHKAFLDDRESVEDEPRCGRPCTSKRTKMWPKWGISWGLIDVWQSEWSVVCWIWITKPSTTQKKGSSCPARVCGHLDATSWQCSLSHCNHRERIFGQKRYFSGSAATILAWSESVWLLPFPKTQFHLKGRHFVTVDYIQKVVTDQWGHFYMKTSSTATGSGNNVSGDVWLPKGTALKGIMLFYG